MSAPAIHLSDVEFRWKSGSSGFSLSIPELAVLKGEKVLLMGASGSGKSTLLGLVCGILVPQSGVIEILGEDLQALSGRQRDRFRADHIGVIFQQFNLIPYLDVIDNVLLPLEFSSGRGRNFSTNRQLRRSEAAELLAELGIGEGHLEQHRSSELSIGQQQRVAAARAFLGGPQLIIADEPTSSLDEGHQEDFLEVLFRRTKKTDATLLMVSHDSRLAKHFDRVLDLSKILSKNTDSELA